MIRFDCLLLHLIACSTAAGSECSQRYAIPLEQDPRYPTIWFADSNLVGVMDEMHIDMTLNGAASGWCLPKPDGAQSDVHIHQQMSLCAPNKFLSLYLGLSRCFPLYVPRRWFCEEA
jgi:hypothetical protein